MFITYSSNLVYISILKADKRELVKVSYI